jgi:hypothetical protein
VKNESQKTIYGVYIIESLEEGDFKDGNNLHKILKISHIASVYKWAKSIEHFEELLKDFRKSNFRYLHLSCHANGSGIEVNGENISNQEFQIMLGDLNNKRIFISACKAANRELATLLICKSGALSLVGTPIDVDFDVAAILWPAFYYVMKGLDEKKMPNEHLKKTLKECVDLLKVPINSYSKIKDDQTHIRRFKIRAGLSMDNRLLIVKFND